ncbi:hypothetical protein BC830DRAFT_618801 [Chytriomyces sp. MP71]|nr:hypothetical protein BC830DRAFT_618801 [Chytriomyces sp. MP71]
MFIGYGRTRMAGFDTREYVYALISLLKPSRANADLDPFMMDEDDFEFGGMGGGGGGALAGEVMLLACRCLSNLIEANPSALAHLCGSGCDGVAVLVDKLQAVEYIELAEQVLAVLEKVCNEYPSLIVKENGLHACLQYLDFFSLHVQRMAVGIVAKSCRGLGILSNDRTQEILQKLSPVLPVLETLLTTNADPKLVESSIRALDAIVAAAARSESVLESLVTPPLLRALVSALKPPSSTGGAAAAGTPVGSVRASVTSPGAIGPSQQQGSAGNFSTLVKMLVAVCKGSAGLCAQLVGEVGGPVVIFAYLTGVTDGSCGTGGQGSVVERIVGRPAEEVLQVLVLAGEMVPALGREGVWCMRKEPEKQTVTAASAGRSKKKKEAVPLEPQSFDTRKRGVLKEDTAVQEYALRLLPVMMEVFGTSVHAGVKKLAVEAAAKCVLCVEDAGILNATLLAGGFGRFVYELLNARVVAFGEAAPAAERGEALVFCAAGVQITRVVVDKCGGGVVGVLLREGILSEVRKCVEVLEKVVSMNEDVAEEVVSTPPTSEGRVLRSRKSDDKGKSVNPSPSRASLAPIDPSTAGISTGFFEGMRQALGKMTGTQAATQHAAVSGACPQLTIIGLNGQRYTEDEVRDWLLQVSTDFLKDMGENKALFGGSGDASFDVLGDLKKACNILKGTKVSLKAPIKGSASDSVAFSDSLMLEELQRIADNFAGQRGHGGVTGFEVLESGIVDALTAYLTCAGDRETNDALYRAGLLDRLRAFLHVFMDGVNPNVSAGSQYVPHAFRQLVGRLQECLSRVEEFELTQAVPAGAGSGLGPSEALLSMLGGGSGLSFGGNAREQANPALQLSRQIRVKLMAEEPETVPASYRGVVVSIHAIATVKAFEDFLKGKLGSITPGAAGKIVGEGDSSEEEREEGEAVIDEDDDDNQDEDEDDEERDDAGNQLVDLMETDEEGISPSTLSPSTTVHVIGSEPVSLAHSSQAPSSSPTPPTAAVAPGASLSEPRSYASATIASQNAYKIIFTLGDRVLSKDETIFGALYTHEQLNLDKDGSNHTNANIWGKIFTIKYKRVQNAGEMGHPTMEGALKADLSSSSHLPFKVPFSMERPSAISKESSAGRVAFLLRILAALNTRWNEIYDEHHASSHIAKLIPVAGVATAADGATGIPITTDVASSSSVLSPIPPSSFINSKITSKLNKQLNEPLIVASGVLPPWCNAVACDYSFLVPFETRLLYLQSTAFGYARSIGRWKQTDGQQDNGRFRGGMDPASMIGRIQRQKVRISRARIVDSMIRVMESYGSSNTMIEVEFFDEVGTGLGPTLEFYSTVCKELRRRAGCSVSGDGEGAGSPSRASAISLWRENGVADEFLNPAEGLFPGPLSGDMAETEAGRFV